MQEGIFPYEYVDSISKLDVTIKHNTTAEDFYSNLNLKGISKEDFKHIRNAIKTFLI